MDLGRWILRLRSGQAAEGGCPHMSPLGAEALIFWDLKGTAEAVPFPSWPLAKISRGIGPWNPTSRKGRETWGTPAYYY
jgi:hypothetical protein